MPVGTRAISRIGALLDEGIKVTKAKKAKAQHHTQEVLQGVPVEPVAVEAPKVEAPPPRKKDDPWTEAHFDAIRADYSKKTAEGNYVYSTKEIREKYKIEGSQFNKVIQSCERRRPGRLKRDAVELVNTAIRKAANGASDRIQLAVGMLYKKYADELLHLEINFPKKEFTIVKRETFPITTED